MKKTMSFRILIFLIYFLAAIPSWAQDTPNQKVRLLIFGNSFSGNSTKNLPQLAKEGGKDLVILNLVKGGCSLQEHATAIRAAEIDPNSAKAKFYLPYGTLREKFPANVPITALQGMEAGPWDYVSIQQNSALSFRPETFEPSAKAVVDFIRAKAPSAKIVVHETWAYREDDTLFKNGTLTTEKMYQALKTNYEKLATDYSLLFLPIGDAFQAARQTPEWTYVKDPKYDFNNPPSGVLPDQKGSLNVGYIWRKASANIATPEAAPENDTEAAKASDGRLSLDAHHANSAGEYLGACVWYEFLFNDDVTKLTQYLPRDLTPEQAASLRKIAHETVAKQRQAQPTRLPAP